MQPAVLIVPGYTGSDRGHWQTLWEVRNPWYQRVAQRDWHDPVRVEWVGALEEAVARAQGRVVLVGHSLGCITIVHWAQAGGGRVCAAFLVAPSDADRPDYPAAGRGFSPIPLAPLPFPSLVVASENDPVVDLDRARFFARRWGSRLVNIGRAGHIDSASGLGCWTQGERLLRDLISTVRCREDSTPASGPTRA